MTQEILVQGGEKPFFRSNEVGQSQLQQLCQLAQAAQGNALLDIIKQALDAPAIYVFGELLVLTNVQEVISVHLFPSLSLSHNVNGILSCWL